MGDEPRILHVSQPVDDGVAVVVGDLVRFQAESEWDVVVASPNGGLLPASVRQAAGRHIAWAATRRPGPGTAAEVRCLSRIIREVGPDVVHLHSSKAGLAGRLAIRGRLPTVFSPHAWSFFHVAGPTGRAALEWERLGARWADVVLCGSQDEMEAGRAAGIAAHYRVIPNQSSIDDPGLSQAGAREALGLDAGRPLVVCFGRYARQKGQDIMVRAWPDVRDAVPEAQLVLVGSGPDEEMLRSTASADVIFAEGGDRANVARWIVSADVLAFPSRWETLSLAVLEALQLGRAVVVSDCQGMAEALEGGMGTMVAKEDSSALAQALVPYLADRDWAAQQGQLAAARFEEVHGRTRADRLATYSQMLRELIDR